MTGSGRGDARLPEAEAIAARVLELVRARSGDAEAEVNVRTGESALTRFANSRIHQNVAEDLREVALRVAVDGRVAAGGHDGPTDDAALDALVASVFEAAAVTPVDADWPGLTPPTPAQRVDHWDEATSAASPDDRAGIVRDFVHAAGGLETAGAVSTDSLVAAFANSAGQALVGRSTVAMLSGIARTPTSDGVARGSAVALAEVDGTAAGALAARKARDGADPGDIDPGRYPVVLEPSCVADVLAFLVIHGFGGRPQHEGRSFVRLGEQQLDPAITIRQDPSDPRLSGFAFDAEGTPRARLDVVREGVPVAALHDRRTARRAGAASTGNAALGPNPWGGVPSSLILDPGDAPAGRLVEGLERGLLVSDFWYTRVLDPRTLVITGLTRNGVWLVEDGRVVRPVANLRFTQSYATALAPGSVEAVGDDATLFPLHADGQLLVPSLRLSGWSFTGGAKG